MTPGSELDRLFGQVLQTIPKPDALVPMEPAFQLAAGAIASDEFHRILNTPDPVDADEAVHGVCAQGDCDEQ